MKFLVLALCVCAASAASFGGYTPFQRQVKPAVTAKAVPKTPVRAAAKVATVVGSPVIAPAVVVAKAVAEAPEYVPQAAKTVAASTYKVHDDVNSEILRNENNIEADGYKSIVETSNGIAAESYGTLKQGADNTKYLVVQGSYRYLLEDGTPVEVTYIADENGFQPESRFLPVAPPTPEAILRSLEFIASQPKYEEKQY